MTVLHVISLCRNVNIKELYKRTMVFDIETMNFVACEANPGCCELKNRNLSVQNLVVQ